jgi:hypothetical protein
MLVRAFIKSNYFPENHIPKLSVHNFYFLCKITHFSPLIFRNEISGLRSSSTESALFMNTEMLFYSSLSAYEQLYSSNIDRN